MKKTIGALVIGLGISITSFGQQDKHFSMFAESPMYLNPAAAGFHEAHLQAFTNFRMQWMTLSDEPFRTISGSVDWRMFENGSFMGAGVNFFNDAAGASNFQTNVLTVPINYAIEVGRDNHFAIGLQPGFYQRTLTTDGLTWDNQWNGIQFNQGISSNEGAAVAGANITASDISAGVFWYANLSREFRVSLGLAGHHLSKQRIGYYNDNDRLYRKLTLHGQFEYKTQMGVSILPAFMAFVQGPNKEITLGSNFRWNLRGASRSTGHFDEIHFGLGAYYRTRDAVMANMIIEFGGLGIGANYDLNLSGLTVATNGVGAMEFFLRWKMTFGGRSLSNPLIH